MKRLCLLSILTLVIFSGCSAKDITINKEKNDSDSGQTAAIEASDESSNEEPETEDSVTNSDVDNSNETINLRPKMGERFLAETMVSSGEFYATVNSAQIFHNLNDSGITQDELLPYSLLEDGKPREEPPDGVIFDKETGDMLNGWGIVKLHMTVENVNGISAVSVDFDEYDEDMFRADVFSVCNTDNSSMTNPINHRTYREIFFSKSGENNIHPMCYTCHKGETVEYDIAYIFNCKPEYLAFSVSTGNKMDTMVYLELTE